nr:hypothetical protein [uncultured Desulfobacter sp.]
MKGSILRVKHGYNPNSSSMGSIIFVLPLSLIGVAFGTAAVSSLILPHFIKEKSPLTPPHQADSHQKISGTDEPAKNPTDV